MSEETNVCCPKCGTEMNHHAEKLDQSRGDEDDLELGGVVVEIHTCPVCRFVLEREAR
jgi:ssDNA-binding Zn-finger/Zn-ribbon topoisomerase 1